jgi:hypothetical protein
VTPEILCVGDEMGSPTVQHCFCGNINPFWEKGLWLKLDSSGNEIRIGWCNSPEYMLLWQIECSRNSIVTTPHE